MKINVRKRIGEVVIVTEGNNPEFKIIKGIFHNFLGYTVYSKKRNKEDIVELAGYDVDSRILLLNTPTNNINCLENEEDFYDFLYKEISKKFDVDLTNDSTFIIFDRDRKNNRYGITKKLINALTESQNDGDEQNGLLLLSYPSIEAFEISVFEDDAYKNTFSLGSEAKAYVDKKAYGVDYYYEQNIKHATDEFIKYLNVEKIINNVNEIIIDMGKIGDAILEKQTEKMQRDQTYSCVSQVVQILIDLGIIELE